MNAPTLASPVVTTALAPEVFTQAQHESMKAFAAGFAQAEDQRDEAVKFFADLPRAADHHFTWLEWKEAQAVFAGGYRDEKPSISTAALDKATGRFFDLVLKVYKTARPESNNPEAAKKKAQREAQRAALAQKALEDTRTNAELTKAVQQNLAAYAENLGKPTAAFFKKAAKEAEAVLKARTSTEADQAKEALAQVKEALRAAVKACDDIEVLQMALDIIAPNQAAADPVDPTAKPGTWEGEGVTLRDLAATFNLGR